MSYFTPANPLCQQEADGLVERVTEAILCRLGAAEVVSVLLIGSLARGEGVWKSGPMCPAIQSDLDLFVVTRWQRRVPNLLRSDLERLERESGVSVDVRLAPRPRLCLYPKTVGVLDIYEHHDLLFGPEPTRWLPRVDADALDHKDIAYSFFNEVILSVAELSPVDLTASDQDSLSRLSYRATKTLFTCAGMMCLHRGCYRPTMSGRIALVAAEKQVPLADDGGVFLEDLRSAYAFRFEEPDVRYLPGALASWHRARNYLVEAYRQSLDAEYGTRDVTAYPRLTLRDMPPTEWVRDLYGRFLTTRSALRVGRIPWWSGWTSPSTCCRMAALMLYLALDEQLDGRRVLQADAYLSRLYRRRPSANDGLEAVWTRLRDELMTLHQDGVF